MIISDSHRFVFLHNPKCGGTTVRLALRRFDTNKNHFWMFEERDGVRHDKAHMPLGKMRTFYPDHFARMQQYFAFVFVRDPYARSVSAFNETRTPLLAERDSGPAGEADYKIRLNKFLRMLSPRAIDGSSVAHRHFVRQVDMVYLDKKSQVDLVIRLEDMASGIEALRVFRPKVATALAAAKPTKIKASKTRAAIDYLDPMTIQHLNKIYQDDFRVFGYPMIQP